MLFELLDPDLELVGSGLVMPDFFLEFEALRLPADDRLLLVMVSLLMGHDSDFHLLDPGLVLPPDDDQLVTARRVRVV